MFRIVMFGKRWTWMGAAAVACALALVFAAIWVQKPLVPPARLSQEETSLISPKSKIHESATRVELVPVAEQTAPRTAMPGTGELLENGKRMPVENSDAFMKICLAMKKANREAMPRYWGMLFRVSESERGILVRELIDCWARLDPKAASVACEELPHGDLREAALMQLTASWVKSDASAAIGWIRSRLQEKEQKRRLLEVFPDWVKIQPADAQDFVQNTEDPALRQQLIMKFARYTPKVSAVEALAWVQHWREEDQPLALAQISRIICHQDPNRALDLVESTQLPSAEKQEARLAVLNEWATFEPIFAAQWYDQQPADVRPAAAIVTIAAEWSKFDLMGAGNWLQSVTPGPERDRAVGIYAVRLAAKDSDTAAAWIQSIADPALRKSVEEIVANSTGSSSSSLNVSSR